MIKMGNPGLMYINHVVLITFLANNTTFGVFLIPSKRKPDFGRYYNLLPEDALNYSK
jgi:hypothetical protein